MAPELLLNNSTSTKCDMWSIGVFLFTMLSGISPFSGSDLDITEKIKAGTWEFEGPIWISISKEAKDLVTKLMSWHVHERINAVDALAHPWM